MNVIPEEHALPVMDLDHYYRAFDFPVLNYYTAFGFDFQTESLEDLSHRFRKPKEKPHFAVDSTVHEQHGSKIEGCAYNYDGIWCLNSEVVFDEMGIAYAGILETGNTRQGADGLKLLDQVLEPLLGDKIKAPRII